MRILRISSPKSLPISIKAFYKITIDSFEKLGLIA
jgi:hypothetical protein